MSSAEAIQKLIQECQREKVTTGRFTIADEKTWNVFMRLDVTIPILLTLHHFSRLLVGPRDSEGYGGDRSSSGYGPTPYDEE